MVNNLITCVVRNVVVVVHAVFFLQTRNREVNVYICLEGGGGMCCDRMLTNTPSASYCIQTTTAFAPQKPITFHLSRNLSSKSTASSLSAMPICIVVEAEIKDDRMEDFLDMIEKNAIGSRAEPGCIRFGT